MHFRFIRSAGNRERLTAIFWLISEGVPIGVIPSLVLAAIFGLNSALGSAIGTMFLSFGNAFMFGGLLATLPDQESFDRFQEKISILKSV